MLIPDMRISEFWANLPADTWGGWTGQPGPPWSEGPSERIFLHFTSEAEAFAWKEARLLEEAHLPRKWTMLYYRTPNGCLMHEVRRYREPATYHQCFASGVEEARQREAQRSEFYDKIKPGQWGVQTNLKPKHMYKIFDKEELAIKELIKKPRLWKGIYHRTLRGALLYCDS